MNWMYRMCHAYLVIVCSCAVEYYLLTLAKVILTRSSIHIKTSILNEGCFFYLLARQKVHSHRHEIHNAAFITNPRNDT